MCADDDLRRVARSRSMHQHRGIISGCDVAVDDGIVCNVIRLSPWHCETASDTTETTRATCTSGRFDLRRGLSVGSCRFAHSFHASDCPGTHGTGMICSIGECVHNLVATQASLRLAMDALLASLNASSTSDDTRDVAFVDSKALPIESASEEKEQVAVSHPNDGTRKKAKDVLIRAAAKVKPSKRPASTNQSMNIRVNKKIRICTLESVQATEKTSAKKSVQAETLVGQFLDKETGKDWTWPPGWKRRTVPRSKSPGKMDTYYYTPENGFELRAIKQVVKYLEAFCGDEEATMKAIGGTI